MKFAHIADTHIKNLKYHYEYKIVFEKLYNILREEKVDYIVHCGDIAHTKTQISPEFVDMCSSFFRNLADIAPTYIILGNHDGNLRNSTRQDALTPIVEALANPNIHLLKNSGEVPLKGDITLNVLSVFDEEGWVKPSDPDRVNIALYHGSVSGVVTDTGWVMTHGDHPIEIFKGHDYGFLGDIHKTDQRLDEEGKIRYCGSTIQQNHGETNDKGFLIWEIQDKENFTCRHIELKNPRPFVTIDLTAKGKIPRGTKVPEKCRLRLASANNLPIDVLRKATDVAKRRFSPESVNYLNRSTGRKGTVHDMTHSLRIEDLRDMSIQESLIKEYLKDYQVTPQLMKRVLDLNAKYNKVAEENEEVSRNVNWRFRSIEFENLFNYGEGNSINFDKMEGIVGIFGKNFSGKSSIIDSMLYTIFNSTSKNDRKTVNIINQNKNDAIGKIKLSAGDRDFFITRNSEKYKKNLKGETTTEARTKAEFTCYDHKLEEEIVLNGRTRNETDKNIRKMFGTLDDFLYSSMSSQLDSLSFIKEGSTRRKEILAKFLDLEFFETKFKLAKEDVSITKGALKKLEDRDFVSEIVEAQASLDDSTENLYIKKAICESCKEKIEEHKERINSIEESIKSIPAEIIDIVKVRQELSNKKNQIISLRDQNIEYTKRRDEDKAEYEMITDFLSGFDEKTLYDKQGELDGLRASIRNLEEGLQRENRDLLNNQKRVTLLEGIPCGTTYPRCKFIRDAYVSKAHIPANEQKIDDLECEKEELNKEVEKINPDKVKSQIEKYHEIVDKKNELSNRITTYDLKIEKNMSALKDLMISIGLLDDKISEYELNKDAIENLEKLNSELRDLKFKQGESEVKLDECNEEVLDFYKIIGSLEQKIKNLKDQRQSYRDLEEEFSAYDLYMRAMHANGIAFDVIRRKLPIINEEIAKILANIVDFDVFFEDDGKRLDIFIKHASYEPRPLEMGSGAEKTISAMAIRLALLSVSNLPKSDIFILDEPGTALDEENMQGFIDILSIIRAYFKTVLLISHLDSLKDCVDMQIDIDKKNGYALVNV